MADQQLEEIKRMINAEKSDLFDVLAYIAFALAPITRQERVETRRGRIFRIMMKSYKPLLILCLRSTSKRG